MNVQYVVKVGMADLNVIAGPGMLKTIGLGSCVGVTLYDPKVKVGGMAHVMLPFSSIASEQNVNIGKYADTAIPQMILMMVNQGASVRNMEAKLAGGAQMFAFPGNNVVMRIGPRNVETCKQILKQYEIRIKAEDTGGNYGRTIEFNTSNGKLLIRSVQQEVKEI